MSSPRRVRQVAPRPDLFPRPHLDAHVQAYRALLLAYWMNADEDFPDIDLTALWEGAPDEHRARAIRTAL